MIIFRQLENGQRKCRRSTFNPGRVSYYISLPICFTRSYRMAASMWKRIVQDFQSQLYKTCGIRSLVFTAYESEERDLKICM